MPARGGAWLAYSEGAGNRPAREPARAIRRPRMAESRENARPEYGTDLVLRDLATGAERTFPGVTRVLPSPVTARRWSTPCQPPTATENGVYAVTPGSDGALPWPSPTARASTRGSRGAAATAISFSRPIATIKPRRRHACRCIAGHAAARRATPLVCAGNAPACPRRCWSATAARSAFSRDGRKVYVPMAPPPRPAPSNDLPQDDRVLVDLWHWQDDVIQPMQRVRANQERSRHVSRRLRSRASAATCSSPTRRCAPSRSATMATRAIGMDDGPYRRMVDYDGTYNDVYLVDAQAATRTLLLKQLRGGGGPGGGLQWSPDGKFAFFYQDKQWHLLDADARTTRDRHRASLERRLPRRGRRHAGSAGGVRKRRLAARQQVVPSSTTATTSGRSSPTHAPRVT